MKYFIATLTLVLSATAMADQRPMSPDVSKALNMVVECPKELAALAKRGFISSTSELRAEDLDQLSINFSTGGWAPSFQTELVATLVIKKTFIRTAHIPDRPGQVAYDCKIVEAEQK